MKYRVALKPRAMKDLNNLPKKEVSRIVDRLALLEDNMKGDMKRLTHVTPEYRTRSGNYRGFYSKSKMIESSCIVLNTERIFIDDTSPANNRERRKEGKKERRKEGKKEFVVIPYEEFLQLQEQLEDYEDLKDPRDAKNEEQDAPTTPLAEVKKSLEL